ncbi:hypothetical protein ACFWHL_21225 [Streptomyces massasporeus]
MAAETWPARLPAGRAERVHGIDADPEITARARQLTHAAAPVTYAGPTR